MTDLFPPERRSCAIIALSKCGPLRFLSHLDLARVMDRAVRRAKVPVAYSEGFHPHAKISFGPPLPIGMAGLRELCLLDLARPLAAADLTRALARQLPPGMELVSVEITSRGRRSPLGEVRIAGYHAALADPAHLEALARGVAALLAAPYWRLLRATKSKVTEVDIRPGILALEVAADRPGVTMELSLAPEALVKPEEVLAALSALAGEPPLAFGLVTRTHLR